MFQLEFLKEVVTVLGNVVLGGLGACLTLFEALLSFGNLGGLGSLNGFGLVDSLDAVVDVTLGTQQRVCLSKTSLKDAVTDACIEFVQEIVVDLRITFGHLTDQFLIGFLLGVQLLQGLLVLLACDFVLLLEVLDLVFALLQLPLQGATDFAF